MLACYLTKRVPLTGEISAVAYARTMPWIACGSKDGSLKLFKVDYSGEPGTVESTQPLSGHSHCISTVAFNEESCRLTSSDSSGLTIVWRLGDGWKEEMRSRAASAVTASAWSQGKVAIGFADGSVLVGSAEGHRLWMWAGGGSDEGVIRICWGKNGQVLVASNGVAVLDGSGFFIEKIPCASPEISRSIVALDYSEPNGVLIVSESGAVQVGKDEFPDFWQTCFTVTDARWGAGPTVIVLGKNDSPILTVFSSTGFALRNLKFPGFNNPRTLSLGTGSLCIGGDNFIYFACLRYYPPFCASGNSWLSTKENTLSFREEISRNFQVVEGEVLAVCGAPSGGDVSFSAIVENTGNFFVSLFDQLGSILISAEIPFQQNLKKFPVLVKFCGEDWLVVARGNEYMTWKFLPMTGEITLKPEKLDFMIAALSGSRGCAFLASEKGDLLKIKLSCIPEINVYGNLSISPIFMSVNNSATQLAVIDVWGVLRVYGLEISSILSSFPERRDAWQCVWATDEPGTLSVLEKNKMYIFRDGIPEEPLLNGGQLILSIADLVVRSIPGNFIVNELSSPICSVSIFETKSLREFRDILHKVRNFHDAYEYVKENPHPKIWGLLAESALLRNDWETAIRAFMSLNDFKAVETIRNFQHMDANAVAAEIAFLTRNFNELNRIVNNRYDLRYEFSLRTGDWMSAIETGKNIQGDIYLLAAESALEKQEYIEAGRLFELGKNSNDSQLCKILSNEYSVEQDNQLETVTGNLKVSLKDPKVVDHFMLTGQKLTAVRYLKQCGSHNEAVRLLFEMCGIESNFDILVNGLPDWLLPELNNQGKRKLTLTPIQAKKVYLYSALQARTTRDVWQGCEAYHLLILAYERFRASDYATCLRITLRASENAEFLCGIDIWVLMAITSLLNNQLAICSSALSKLERLCINKDLTIIRNLSCRIFADKPPKDSVADSMVSCPYKGCRGSFEDWRSKCSQCHNRIEWCTRTGRMISASDITVTCKLCSRKHFPDSKRMTCPLCHVLLS